MQTYKKYAVLLLQAFLVILMAGCGGSGDSAGQTGTLHVSLTDAPAGVFDAVNVTVSKVRVHKSAASTENDAGWTDITLNPARKINLLNLSNGVLEDLGQTSLPVGHYTQLRLVLDATAGSNSVVLAGTTAEIPLDTPSAVQSGIKLINEFDVASGQRVDLVLDFDAGKSIVPRGNGSYALKPVIQVVPTLLNGISGFIDTSLLGSNVAVSAQVNGKEVRATVPNGQTGEFFLARLETGSYDVVITANGRATAVIAGVPVTSASTITAVSTAAARLALPPLSATQSVSGTVTLNPTSTEVASVAAKQTFGTGPTVTVLEQAVDLLSGNYVLTLPIGAPLLGQYGLGSLPIAFTAQTAAAGKYAVAASATGYQTQSVNSDLSTAPAINNFTLIP